MEGGMWGIVICISGFMIQVLAFGVSASIGVINIELLDYFDQATFEVSLISAINFGLFLGGGPIVSYLMSKFSWRKISLFGSALTVLGLLGTPLLPYIPSMCICFGVLTGFGCCCVYIPSHTLSGVYYERYRSAATGVVTSGSGLGGIVFPVLTSVLIDAYAWKGTFIFMAGLCLHLFIFSMTLLQPPGLNKVVKENSLKDPLKEELDAEGGYEYSQKGNGHCIGNNNGQANLCNDEYKQVTPMCEDTPMNVPLVNNEANQSIQKSVSLKSIHSVGFKGSACAVNVLRENGNEDISAKPPKHSRHIFIFTHFPFDVYFISNIMWNAGGFIVTSFLPEFLRQNGYTPNEAAIFFAIAGFGIFIGCIVGGLIGNLKFINREILYTAANITMGTFILIIPYVESRVMLYLTITCYGFSFGIILGLLIIVLTDIVGIDSLANAMGYLMFANGAGAFIGPPIAGLLREPYGLKMGMIVAGLMCILGGVCMFFMPLKTFFSSKSDKKESKSGLPENGVTST